IERVVEAYGIEPAELVSATSERTLGWINDAPGLPFQITHPALCELPRIAAERPVRVVVGGEFADDVCGELGRITDWALATSPGRILTPASRPFGRRDILRRGQRRLLCRLGRPALPFRELPDG